MCHLAACAADVIFFLVFIFFNHSLQADDSATLSHTHRMQSVEIFLLLPTKSLVFTLFRF